jgi:hypothetical protein
MTTDFRVSKLPRKMRPFSRKHCAILMDSALELAQKETTRWRRAAWRKPASQSTAAGLACDASDSICEGKGKRLSFGFASRA